VTESPPARPVPVSRVWSGGRIIAEDLEGDDLSDVLETHPDASAWWVMERNSAHTTYELRQVGAALEFDHLALADIQAADGRAKVEELGPARLVVTGAVSIDREAVRLSDHPLSVILTDRVLIVLVDPTADFHPARALVDHHESLVADGVEAGLRLVLSAVVASYEEAESWLEDAADDLADALFEERPLNKDEQLHAFRLRSALSHLRRLTEPMRAVLADLVDAARQSELGAKRRSASARYWRLLTERQERVANAADSLRDALGSVFDTSLALADLRLNQTMKKLSGWAAIVAVPTLVTGFVGENVAFPLAGTATGFWVYLAIMVVSGFALWLLFRRLDWV
jgi:magnesium transporter